jgi:hypothetical protein
MLPPARIWARGEGVRPKRGIASIITNRNRVASETRLTYPLE